MRFIKFLIACAAGVAATTSALAAQALVDVAWLKANMGKPGVVLLDIRAAKAFEAGRIPGSVNSPYGGKTGWRQDKVVGPDKKKDVIKGLLPSAEYLEKLISKAGVKHGDHVVVVAMGKDAADIGSATRVYWTLLVAGHDNVSVLNGGLLAWLADKANPIAKGPAAEPAPSAFKVKLDTRFLAGPDEVRTAAAKGLLIDSRPTDQYLGINKSGAVTRHGRITGAASLPGIWTTTDNKGKFRPADEIRKLYAYNKAPMADGTVTYCNTGHWASLGWFVDHAILGKKNARMYDGSLTEWSRLQNAPMEAQVSLR
ncbi:MAG: rhodanese-like domain-containing protein [Burkholderiaceae bacterium]